METLEDSRMASWGKDVNNAGRPRRGKKISKKDLQTQGYRDGRKAGQWALEDGGVPA